MKNYQKLAINITILTFLLTGGVSLAYADSSDSNDNLENDTTENREIAILESFENNDYEKWKKYMGENSNLVKFVSKEKFEKFVKIRSLARSGRYDEALNESEKFEKEIGGTLDRIVKIKNVKKGIEKKIL